MLPQHAVQAFLIAAVLSPFSFYAGLVAKKFRLPQITGYLVSGMLCGPYGLGILSSESVTDLGIIEGSCLGIIGLAAGAELHLAELNRSKKQVVALTACICAFTWLFCYVAISWSAALTPVLPHVTSGQLAAIASLGGTLMMARSPASAIAVLKEMDAKGPFVSLVMGVVVLKDVVVIVLFAINMELVPLFISSKSSFSLSHLLLPFLSVGVSLSAGLLAGFVMSLALQYQAHNRLATALLSLGLGSAASHSMLLTRCKQVIVLLLSTCLFSLARSLDAEPLLACVTAGMLLANRRLPGAGDMVQEEQATMINGIMQVTNVAFFGLAGASLKLAAIAESVWVALVVFLARLAAITAGSALGCKTGGVKSELHQRCFWMSMITQAGVAMGLARIAGTAFSDWGPAFQTIMMAIIMINMLLGPPLFRSALLQVGEARAHLLPSGGHHLQQLHRDASVAPPDLPAAAASKQGAGWALSNSSSSPALAAVVELGASSPVLGAGKGEDAGEGFAHHVVVSSGALLHSLGAGKAGAKAGADTE